jgi:hypothetical protein
MAKIDISKIQNYQSMTVEQKIAALEAYEIDVPDAGELERYKSAASKANSEAAEWKRKHNALLSEDERKEAERAESEKAMKERLESLEREKSISDYKAQYLALGYDDTLAGDTAKAHVNGDMAKVIANQKAFIDKVRKAERAAALADDPVPPAGKQNPTVVTKEKFDTMTSAEQMEFIQKNPNWKQIIKPQAIKPKE